ncbi:META domain-containing protein [Streptomyces brasiliensis]|uniref:Lipoprotein n=1 Tax=Streptomyces brasiliensis TaxID=1954 RepID=A0A917L4X0_9ACTN|nr:META domain-containing protein [Streptomyces brasiliensis]GGJ43261.1 lipoprotein [Streptomyces brasiliensis]
MDPYPTRLAFTAVAALFPLVAACGVQQAGSSDSRPPVAGVHWTVDSVTVDGTTRRAPAGAYAEIDAGRAAGNFGCNHFSARAAFEGDRLRLSDATTTEMACAEAPMAFERALARTLTDGPLTTEVRGDRLTLTTGAGDTVRLTREPDAPLYGTTWKITALSAAGTAASLPEGADAHLVFDREQHKVTGRLGCNLVSARATVRDGDITLGTAVTTRMMCDVSLMHTEKSLLRLFGGTVKYRIDHRTLVLTSANGEQVTAVAAP